MKPCLLEQIKKITILLSDEKWSSWDNTAFIGKKSQYIHYNSLLEKSFSIFKFCRIIHEILNKNLYPNDFMFKVIIKTFGQQDPKIAVLIHEIAIKHNLDTPFSYCAVLNAISHSRAPDIPLALEIFNYAKQRAKLDSYVFAKTLEVMGRSAEPDAQLAVELFNDAKDLKLVNEVVFSCTLNVLAKSNPPQIKRIVDLIDQGETQGWVNEIGYSCALNAISRSANPDLNYMMELLQKLKKLKLDCFFAYSSIINVLVKQNQFKEAENLFQEALDDKSLKLPQIRKANGSLVIDLHGYNYGTAYLSLTRILAETTSNKMSVISGKGLHKKLYKNENESEVKCAVKQVMQTMHITGSINKKNSGVIDLELNSAKQPATIHRAKRTIQFFPKSHSQSSQPQFSSNPLGIKREAQNQINL
ncbi:hypothetical protein [Legionella cardiaca]|uniref:Smr domain-containing protein n=1 Tax=Legionella cardiaca TaxID=1071983 RepID=A0ABY8AXT2_9GAMM|nr:hypothetical protein [Legionella cardiaca]WED44559.1 hypothetical protein PXX05_07165 [Legionella cardiaca]